MGTRVTSHAVGDLLTFSKHIFTTISLNGQVQSKGQNFSKKELTNRNEIGYTKNIRKKRKQEEERLMEGTNAKTIETLEREREREP